ncbi:NlpC/P60 family protein [Sphingomonas sp. Leaf37]|uniref:NlpC/P60 family protein n=1 Tax=Sphingomonas sp. Leaf37 TaxID=2876552 RepID=UPI0022A69A01|nr:TIGR02594 family protein [Sphingomonas sp. Leaf37]
MEIDRGCRGQQVQMLQHLLNTSGRARPPLDLDGVFGLRTEQAVRDYQGRNSLAVDGVVGRNTWTALGADRTAAPAARSPASPVSTRALPTRAVPIPSIRQMPLPTGRAIQPAVAAAPAPAPVPAPRRTAPLEQPPGTDIGAPWMRIAIAEKGVSEIRGSQHNRRIIEYHAATGLAAKEDEVAWCASFVNWCLREAGVRGNNSARARDFGSWGRKLDTARYGCIVHLHRAPRGVDASTGSSSGNHVAFFISQTATHITLLGGNQGNRVRESSYPLSQYRVMAMRWPGDR